MSARASVALRRILPALLLLVGQAALVERAAAQFGGHQPAPTNIYFGYFGSYYDGDYVDALRGFMSEGRGAIKTVQSNWIDSICYHAMVGECYYQMGQLPQALSHFNTALQLYTAFPDWMIRVQFAPGVNALQPAQIRAVPWGQRQRPTRFANIPDVVSTLQGQVNNNQVIQQGGVVRPAMLFPIRPVEIVRCTTLAIRRRREILGPLGENDALGKDVLAALARRPTIPNHWTEAWIDLQLGVAYTAVGKIDQAKPVLERSLLLGGEFDHPLTATALLELGRIALLQSDYQTAARLFEEATYDAYQYEDPGIIEEAFRYGFVNHLMSGQPDAYPPLLIAATWAKAQSLRQLHVSLVVSAAENLAILGQTRQALQLLTEARGMMGNRVMLRGKMGARLNYALAVALYQAGQAADGDTALANLLAFQNNSSHWIYQLATTDSLVGDGSLSPRAAMLVYERLLREPDGFDWGYDPIEALSILCSPHSESYENWFYVALERDKQVAFDIADEVRRHRFLSTLPIGGRLLGLRWLLDGPSDMLDRQSTLDRQLLLSRFPDYEPLSQKSREQRAQLGQLPLVAADADAAKSQSAALAAWSETSADQEHVLRAMAVRRNPANRLFPPQRSLKNLQSALGEGQAILSFLTTPSTIYGFLVTSNDFDLWPVDSPTVLQRKLAPLLKELGQTEANREVNRELLAGDKWKRYAGELFELLTHNSKSNFPEGIRELAIVPDRLLWYVPFVALQVGPPGKGDPLIKKVKLRFAPTTGLAVGDTRGPRQQPKTLVVPGRMFLKSDPAQTQAIADQLATAVPGTMALKSAMPEPSAAYSSLVDRLVVLDDLRVNDKDPYDWSPFNDGADAEQVVNWLALPLGAPDQIVLPGFHSSAENGLKRRYGAYPGDELFLNACALQGAGARTILFSQWRTGGETSLDLMREFVQELPHTPAAEAWQRAVALVSEAELSPDNEPRVQFDKKKEMPKAANPFFWAGYLLIDPGQTGSKPDDAAPADVANNNNNNGGPAKPPAAANAAANDKQDAETVQIGGGAQLNDGAALDAGDGPLTSKKKPAKKPRPPRQPRGRKKPATDNATADAATADQPQ